VKLLAYEEDEYFEERKLMCALHIHEERNDACSASTLVAGCV
jgi:hypothetical protein